MQEHAGVFPRFLQMELGPQSEEIHGSLGTESFRPASIKKKFKSKPIKLVRILS